MIEIVCLAVVAASVAALAVVVVIISTRSASSIAQVMAACAESNRQFMVYSEKAVNRTMAAANPINYRSMREVSGAIEGAQAPVEGHYEKPRVAGGKIRRVPSPVAPADTSDTLNGVYETPKNVGTSLDFEDDGGGR